MDKVLDGFKRYIKSVRSVATLKKYGRAVERFLDWLREQELDLEKAPRNTLKNYVIALVEQGLMPNTIHVELMALSVFIKWCRTEEIPVPDFYPVELPKIPVRVKDVLPSERFSAYFKLADGLKEPARTAAMLLPCSGLRATEMVELPLSCMSRTDIALKDGLKKSVIMLRVRGKGDSERPVPLLDEGAQILVGYLKGWRGEHRDTEWLFPSRKKGKHLSDRYLRRVLQDIRKPLKMNFTPHTMRRTYLTTLYKQGVDPMVLTKIAGHKNPKTLLNHYLYLNENDLAGAVHGGGGKLII